MFVLYIAQLHALDTLEIFSVVEVIIDIAQNRECIMCVIRIKLDAFFQINHSFLEQRKHLLLTHLIIGGIIEIG